MVSKLEICLYSMHLRAQMLKIYVCTFSGASGSSVNPLAIVGPGGDILGPTDEREPIAPTQASNEQQVRINNLLKCHL